MEDERRMLAPFLLAASDQWKQGSMPRLFLNFKCLKFKTVFWKPFDEENSLRCQARHPRRFTAGAPALGFHFLGSAHVPMQRLRRRSLSLADASAGGTVRLPSSTSRQLATAAGGRRSAPPGPAGNTLAGDRREAPSGGGRRRRPRRAATAATRRRDRPGGGPRRTRREERAPGPRGHAAGRGERASSSASRGADFALTGFPRTSTLAKPSRPRSKRC